MASDEWMEHGRIDWSSSGRTVVADDWDLFEAACMALVEMSGSGRTKDEWIEFFERTVGKEKAGVYASDNNAEELEE